MNEYTWTEQEPKHKIDMSRTYVNSMCYGELGVRKTQLLLWIQICEAIYMASQLIFMSYDFLEYAVESFD